MGVKRRGRKRRGRDRERGDDRKKTNNNISFSSLSSIE